jgi:aryl-alcohol dehydrogenase-like predicted oxidoreductase
MTIDRRTLLGALAAFPFLGTAACASVEQRAQSSSGQRTQSGLHTRTIPGANEAVPVIGIGTARHYPNPQGEEQLAALKQTIARFVELGGEMIDTAHVYGRSEEVLGGLIQELGVRNRLFLATKVMGANLAEGKVQIEQSFSRLRTDRLDLIYLHNREDVANKLAFLRELKAQGRVRSIGASVSSQAGFTNRTTAAIEAQPQQYAGFEAIMRSERLDAIQVDYALDNRGAAERILPLAQEQGLAVMVNLPFGRGRLFQATQGKPLPDWAAQIGATTWAQFFLKYIVSHPVRPIAIPGMAQARYVEDNLGAARGPMPDAAMRRRMEEYIDAL